MPDYLAFRVHYWTETWWHPFIWTSLSHVVSFYFGCIKSGTFLQMDDPGVDPDPEQLETDGARFARQAVACDQAGQAQTAVFYYTVSADVTL